MVEWLGSSFGTKLETSSLNHFDTYDGKCTYDFPIFRTVPIKISTVKVPIEYSTPGTSRHLAAPPKVTAQ